MSKLKTIILSSLIGVSIISSCLAVEKTNVERFREMAEKARAAGDHEKAAKYDKMANDTQAAMEIADEHLKDHGNEE
jgi:hypothetical protein